MIPNKNLVLKRLKLSQPPTQPQCRCTPVCPSAICPGDNYPGTFVWVDKCLLSGCSPLRAFPCIPLYLVRLGGWRTPVPGDRRPPIYDQNLGQNRKCYCQNPNLTSTQQLGFTRKRLYTTTHHHHTNPKSAISQLLLPRF